METNRLVYFCAIAETGSLTAAADMLNVSHSGLSKAMSVFQKELNLQLFRPLGRGLELTDSGREVYTESKKIVEALEALKNQKLRNNRAKLKIGMSEIFLTALAGPMAQEFKANCEFYEIDAGEAESKIFESEIDFAVSFIPFPHRDLEYLKIKKTSMGVFFANPKFKNLSLAELPFVVPVHAVKNNPLSIKSRDGWPHELTRNAQFGAASLSTALKIVEAGCAAIFLPKFLGQSIYTEYELPRSILAGSDRDIFIVKKRNADEDAYMKTVARLIRKYC